MEDNWGQNYSESSQQRDDINARKREENKEIESLLKNARRLINKLEILSHEIFDLSTWKYFVKLLTRLSEREEKQEPKFIETEISFIKQILYN